METILLIAGGLVVTYFVAIFLFYCFLMVVGFDAVPPWYVRVLGVIGFLAGCYVWWILVASHISITFS